MPALIVADDAHQARPAETATHTTSRGTSNPYPRQPAPRGQHPQSDVFFNHALYDINTNGYLVAQYPQPPYLHRVHSPPSSHSFHNQIPGVVPSSAMFNYFSLPSQGQSMWQVPIIQQNPYPPAPQPPQLVHKVWILDCKSCGTFLTNRGMKAVLLLRPNVSLFSTDALPINCSAYSTNPDAHRPPPCRPSTSASPARTCECLTQTLCCHTCGAAVGYMIVVPCSRCTSSITATNRATNGHRFVFHSSEITASERHHVPDEPGVIPLEYPTPPLSAPPPLAPAYSTSFRPSIDSTGGHHVLGNPVHPAPSRSVSSPSLSSDYPSSPPMESTELASSSVPSSPGSFTLMTSTSPRQSPRPLHWSPSSRSQDPRLFLSQPEPGRSTPDIRGEREPPVRKLKAGDVLYWHHLLKNGEIPGVKEDPRARSVSRDGFRVYFDR
ncbi:hypothetical protein F5I97DRAFT_1854052 [Phlebopus sp. FC_14]|nr:hypothetical protein F5I97DRAFT_1854052 [Phlebopus sp. FC_14]